MDGEGALRQVEALHPGLVLLDIQLPDRDGFAIAEELAAAAVAAGVILISSRSAADYGDRVGRAPVRGFVAKSELSGEAIQRLLA